MVGSGSAWLVGEVGEPSEPLAFQHPPPPSGLTLESQRQGVEFRGAWAGDSLCTLLQIQHFSLNLCMFEIFIRVNKGVLKLKI